MQLTKSFKEIRQHKILSFIIISLAIAPSVLIDKETMVNWLIVGAISCSPILLLIYTRQGKGEIHFWLFQVALIFIVLFFHMDTVRWTTILFGIAFIIYFIGYMRIVQKERPKLYFFLSILKLLIYAYWIVLIIQQFCVLFGLPIFNVCAYNPAEPWKLNSLMSEPSHSARIIPLLMYIYISIKEIKEGYKSLKESYLSDRILWFAFLYSCITMQSSTAYIFMLIVFAKFLNKKAFWGTVILFVSLYFIISFSGTNKYLQRVLDIAVATTTLDEDKIIDADGSGAYRIVPIFRGAKAIGISNVKDFFGHGIDADMKDILPLPGTDKGCAGPFVIWYNYGLILQFFYWILTLSICYSRKDKVTLFVWFLCVFNYGGMNNQIVWLSITLLYSYKYCISQRLSNVAPKVLRYA